MPPHRHMQGRAGAGSVVRTAMAVAMLVAWLPCVTAAGMRYAQNAGDLFSLLQTTETNFNVSIQGLSSMRLLVGDTCRQGK